MELLDEFLKQLGIVQHAWIPFLLATAIVAVVIWRAMDWRYGGIIDRLKDERDSLLRRNLDAPLTPQVSKPPQPLKPPQTEWFLPPAPSPELPVKRVFVGKPAEFLLGLFEGKTHAQVKKLAEPFKDKWIKVTAIIDDVYPTTDFEHVSAKIEGGRANLSLAFAQAELPRVEALTTGERITVVGQIKDLGRHEMQLVLCEFADS